MTGNDRIAAPIRYRKRSRSLDSMPTIAKLAVVAVDSAIASATTPFHRITKRTPKGDGASLIGEPGLEVR